MLQYQSHSRSSEARDFALLIDNNSYVQNWSIAQISVILLTCSIQVGIQIKCNGSDFGHFIAIKCKIERDYGFNFFLNLVQVYFVRKLFDINTGGYGRARI